MAVNKVEMADGEVLVDLTSDSVTENDVLEGKTFHSADGEAKVGKVVVAPIDDELSKTSENPVQNKVITEALEGKADNMTYDAENSKLYLKSGDVVLSEVEIKGGTEPYSYKGWLKSANIEDTFGSLENVLASEITVRELMTKHASSDYLLEWYANNDTILDILILSANAMKWIGLRDYICDKLMALDGVTDKFLASDNWEYILKDHVPTMTSNTAPYGEASGVGETFVSSRQPYMAFDGDDTTSANVSANATTANIYYKFSNPTNIKRFKMLSGYGTAYSGGKIVAKLSYSDDGATWTDCNITKTDFDNDVADYSDVTQDYGYHLYWRVDRTTATTFGGVVKTLQFYGRSLNVSVPTMTSNTAPYGKAIASDADSRVQIYNAFNKVIENSYTGKWSSNSTRPAWIGYKFTNPICVKHFDWYGTESDSAVNYTLQASNDGNNWADIQSYTNNNHNTMVRISNDVNNEQSYLYYRMYVSTTNLNRNLVSIVELNFYGVDYSEREFAEGSTIKYLYDNGLELETFSEYGYGTHNKEELQLYIQNSDVNNRGGFNILSIDLTLKNLLRAITGDKLLLNNTGAFGVTPQNSATLPWVSYVMGSALALPYNSYVDVSSINGNYAITLNATSGGILTIRELWLE